MGDMDNIKESLRERMRAVRAGLSDDLRAEHHRAMAAELLTLAEARSASYVGIYAATGSEADPSSFIEEWQGRGGRFAWPRVQGDELRFHLSEGEGALNPGFRGIHEPSDSSPESALETLDLLIVPGLAFDQEGRRLGAGGGFYDQLLSAPLRPFTVGLAYACQLVDDIPWAPHDQRVDCVLTENGIVV